MPTRPEPRMFFVVTVGRTGSTLLQGLLNSMEGVVVFGENSGFLLPIMDAYRALQRAHTHLKNPLRDRPGNPWYGSSRHSADSLREQFRSFVDQVLFTRLPDGSQVTAGIVGFKEIKHIFIDRDRLVHYLDFLSTLYPGSKIVFLTRDADEVVASGWYAKKDRARMHEGLSSFYSIAREFHEDNQSRSIIVDYQDLISGPETYLALATFIDTKASAASYERTIAKSFSHNNRNITNLLRKKNPDVILIDEQWWRSRVDEFTINATRSGHKVIVDGLLVLRPDHSADFTVSCGRSNARLVRSVATPEVNARFPLHPGSDVAGYRLALESDSDKVELQREDGSIVARTSVRTV